MPDDAPVQLDPLRPAGRRGIPHLRWMIAAMLFCAAVLNYLDRQALSLLAPTIQRELGIDDGGYKWVVNCFLVAYTLSLLATGRLVDKLGARFGMAIFITWWSLANMATALARGVASLGACRFALGLGEAGNWPGSTKAVSEWFNARERAFAIGLYTMGATVGATIAPGLINHLSGRWGWQSAFVATGALGLLWVGPWLFLYRRPEEHPNITAKELATIRGGAPAQPAGAAADTGGGGEPKAGISEWRRWGLAMGRREVWVLMVGRLLTDPLWYFYQFWFAKYLFSARQVSQEGLTVTWKIFLAADIGTLAGGLASGLLVKRRVGAVPARLVVMGVAAAVMPLSLLVGRTNDLAVVIAIAMAAVLAHLAWLANISALVVDLIPRRLVGTCFGIVAAGSAVGGIVMNEVVAGMAARKAYHEWFVVMAFLHPVAWVLVWGVLRGRSAAAQRVAT